LKGAGPTARDGDRPIAVLKGKTAEVERFAERIIAKRGVRHGRVIIIAEIESTWHGHDQRQPQAHQNIHVR
jgi:CopG family transcriptional regulator, nickel-responsive regulator